MGMYSFFEDEDINVTNWAGLLAFIELWRKEFPDEDYNWLCKIIDEKTKTLSFEEVWNYIKLISYWYKNQVIFLSCLSRFIEGYVSWRFETPDEIATVYFEDGKTRFSLGRMSYNDYTAEDFADDDKDGNKEKYDKIISLSRL